MVLKPYLVFFILVFQSPLGYKKDILGYFAVSYDKVSAVFTCGMILEILRIGSISIKSVASAMVK